MQSIDDMAESLRKVKVWLKVNNGSEVLNGNWLRSPKNPWDSICNWLLKLRHFWNLVVAGALRLGYNAGKNVCVYEDKVHFGCLSLAVTYDALKQLRPQVGHNVKAGLSRNLLTTGIVS